MDLTEEDCLNLSNNVSLYGEKDSGLIWDELTKKRIKDPLALEPYGYKVYSQNDEDGIIDEIFKRIGVFQKKFIELGVENGLECNTHFLLFKDWTGLWIEGNPKYVREINNKFSPVIKNNKLHVENVFLTKQNVNSVISRYFSKNEEIDLLSIDIDGNDYYIWDEISSVNPRVVVVEYNGKFPPDIEWCQAYNADHVWNSSDWQGASLLSFEKLAHEKGYTLVGTNIRGVNAFFVRNDLINGKFLNGNSVYFYNPFVIFPNLFLDKIF